MPASLGELMGLHTEGFPPGIFARAIPVARRLPPTGNTAGFELPLRAAWEIGDFSVGVLPADVGDGPFGEAALARRLPADVLAHPSWRVFFELSRRWPVLSRVGVHVQSAWLEFDCEGDAPSLHPGVFVDVTPLSRASVSRYPEALSAAAWEVAEDVVGLAFREDAARGVLAGLAEVRSRCGSACCGFHLGVFHSRGLDTVRLCVKHLRASTAELVAPLAGDAVAGEARKLLAEVADPSDAIYLDFDVGAAVRPALGLEIHFGRRGAPDAGAWDRERWAAGLQALVGLGLCTPEKAGFLLAWPGERERGGGRTGEVLLRNLSHVKLSLRAGRPSSAKAYFWFKTAAEPLLTSGQA